MWMVVSRSRPLRGELRPRIPPPPKRWPPSSVENRSANELSSPRSSKRMLWAPPRGPVPKPAKPLMSRKPPGPTPDATIWRTSSYSLRFEASESTS